MSNEFLNKRMVKATFNPSADTTQRAQAAHVIESLPKNAIVTGVYYDVITTFTSAGGDAGTIAISLIGANDIVSAIAINDGGDPWDAGRHGTLVGYPDLVNEAAHDSQAEVTALFVGTWLKTTAVSKLTVTTAVQNLTAGKMNIFLEYFISE